MRKLPPYRVRESARAKRIIIRHDPGEGLVVIVPRGMDRRELREILEDNRAAFDKVLQRASRDAGRNAREDSLTPPAIDLPCVGETWTVSYTDRQQGFMEIRPRQEARLLEMEGPLAQESLVTGLLQDWLRRRAKSSLLPLIREESERTGLCYDRIQFRIQKTRWGSRSASGTISLNACLLFLEEPLVRHILIHELCHTVHMNHSADFWGLVARFDPRWKEHAAVARRAFTRVPRWALYKNAVKP